MLGYEKYVGRGRIYDKNPNRRATAPNPPEKWIMLDKTDNRVKGNYPLARCNLTRH